VRPTVTDPGPAALRPAGVEQGLDEVEQGLDEDERRGDEDEGRLDEDDMAPAPMAMFAKWYVEARASGEAEADAMSLATVGNDGLPSVRTVLLKAADARGFVVYTNYRSRKGADLDARPVAAVSWRWAVLGRQVRATGWVEPLPLEESDAYFASRPRGSQLGAWASPQSQVIEGRSVLEARLAEVEERFAGHVVPRPLWWGGLRIAPSTVEFWQGRASRLHDRLRYRLDAERWIVERLAP
jgi:pyridoxamine 5'-phosphate oxidase